jgi:hypothetical protein
LTEAPRHFEVEVAGSGAPELLVWFGPQEPSAKELGARRELAAALQKELGAGRGRVHLVIDLGPAENSVAFGLDFPIAQAGGATRFQPNCLLRPDSRAFAEYLVTAPALVGLVELPASRPGTAQATGGNLPGFLRIGLGLKELTPEVALAPPAESQVTLTVDAVLAAMERARAHVRPAEDAVVHLGSDLWQLDLVLGTPELAQLRPDPERTYPRTRLTLALAAWGEVPPAAAPTVGETDSAPAQDPAPAPELVELAWRTPDRTAFRRLAITGGSFVFPGGDLPEGAVLRLIARVPAGIDDVEVTLDTKRAGRATCNLSLGGNGSER